MLRTKKFSKTFFCNILSPLLRKFGLPQIINFEAQLKKAALTFWIPGPSVQKMKPTAIKTSPGWKTKKLLESSTAKEFQTFQESQKNCTLSFSKSSKKTAKMRRWNFFLRLILRVFFRFSYPPAAEIPAEKTMYLFKVSKFPILNQKS